MKNATEMRALADKVREEVANARRAKAIDYVETHIYPQIEHNAEAGNTQTIYQCTAGYDFSVIRETLEKAGYEVEIRGKMAIEIRW